MVRVKEIKIDKIIATLLKAVYRLERAHEFEAAYHFKEAMTHVRQARHRFEENSANKVREIAINNDLYEVMEEINEGDDNDK